MYVEFLNNKLLQIKYDIGLFIDKFPFAYRFWRYLLELNASSNKHLVHDQTEFVIEGYPRSGNSFAYAAFSHVQPHPVIVSHHTHRASQIITAVRKNLPTLVIIRPPIDAVISFLSFRSYLTPRQCLRSYIDFYRRIEPYRDGFVLVKFEDVISDFGQAILDVNEKFNTSFVAFDHTEENISHSIKLVEEMGEKYLGYHSERKVGRPSKVRSNSKERLKREFKNSELHKLVIESQRLYTFYLESNQKL